jgi:hypothetical protein
MENAFVNTLDRGRLRRGYRSLNWIRREYLGSTGSSAGYGSQKWYDANAHEHANGQDNSKEKADAQA